MKTWNRLKTALRAWTRRGEVESELDEELRFHLEMQSEENLRRGMSPEEARRRARQQLGGVEQVRQEVREVRSGAWMEEFAQDVAFAVRMLRKQPGFTLVAVLTLALGIGASTAFFSVLDGVLLRALPYPESERIVSIGNVWKSEGLEHSSLSEPEFVDLKEAAGAFEALGLYGYTSLNLTVGRGAPEVVRGAVVTPGFFRVMGVRPLHGRFLAPRSSQPGGPSEAVLSHGLWQRRFGGELSLLESSLRLDDRVVTIVGVMPRGFHFPSRRTEFWIPRVLDPENMASRGARNRRVVGRLREGATLAQAQAELDALAEKLKRKYPGSYPQGAGFGFGAMPLKEREVGDVRPAMAVLAGAVGLVLLIACANVANLLLARGAARSGEMAVRTALGAGRWRLLRQLLTESVVLALLAGGAGTLAAWAGVGALKALGGVGIPRLEQVQADGRFLLAGLGLALASGLLAGAVPALQVPRGNLQEALKVGGRKSESHGSHRMRRGFVVGEVALALILLIASGLMMQSFFNLRSVDVGIETESVLTAGITLSSDRYPEQSHVIEFFGQLLQRLESRSDLRAAGVVSHLPLGGSSETWSFGVEGLAPEPGQEPQEEGRIVSSDYFAALGIPLLEGRFFDERETPEGPFSVIVSQSAARKYWPGRDPLGRRIKLWGLEFEGPWRTVIGVVDDIRHLGADGELEPIVYYPYTQHPRRGLNMVLRGPGSPETLASALREEVGALDGKQAISRLRPLSEIYAQSLSQPRFNFLLLASFALLALSLAVIGVCGLIAYFVAERRPEIGVRIALGASKKDILKLVLGQSLAMTLLGLALGLPAAWALSTLMESLLFGVSATSPAAYLAVAACFLAASLLASLFPARRALRVDPLEYCK